MQLRRQIGWLEAFTVETCWKDFMPSVGETQNLMHTDIDSKLTLTLFNLSVGGSVEFAPFCVGTVVPFEISPLRTYDSFFVRPSFKSQ